MDKKVDLFTSGAGNMASALLAPMAPLVERFMAYTPSGRSAKSLASSFVHGMGTDDLDSVEGPFDFLFLGFKPQQFSHAANELAQRTHLFHQDTVVVSMLAGTSIDLIKETFKTTNVARIMPNTPSLVGSGITLLCPSAELRGKVSLLKTLEALLSEAGLVHNCQDENELDIITAVTGSGPAYVFEWGRILSHFLQKQGVGEENSVMLVKQLFFGSSKLMVESDDSLEELRNKVTSKNGVTFAALEKFKEEGLENSIVSGLNANIARSEELKRSNKEK